MRGRGVGGVEEGSRESEIGEVKIQGGDESSEVEEGQVGCWQLLASG